MNKFLKRIVAILLITLLFANNVLAVTVQKMYGISANNAEMIKSGLLNIYNNNVETDGRNYIFLYDNEDRYFLSYLAPVNNNYYHYYYLSNVSNQKNEELLNWLKKFNYSVNEIDSDVYIDLYKKKIFADKNSYNGKLIAIKDGTLGEYNTQTSFLNPLIFQNKKTLTNQTTLNQPANNQTLTTNTVANSQIQPVVQPTLQQTTIQQNITPVTIPAGYAIKLLSPVGYAICSTSYTKTITTTLAEDIYIDGKSVIPKGSKVEGTLRPNIYKDYNNNHFDLSFDRIITPDGKRITIRTENRSIYTDLKTQYEYTASTNNTASTSYTSTSSNSSNSSGMSTGAKVALGAVAIGVIALGAILLSGASNSDDNSSSKSKTPSRRTYTGSSTQTNTTYHPVYYSPKTAEDLCSNNNVRIEQNSLIDIIITSPVLINY